MEADGFPWGWAAQVGPSLQPSRASIVKLEEQFQGHAGKAFLLLKLLKTDEEGRLSGGDYSTDQGHESGAGDHGKLLACVAPGHTGDLHFLAPLFLATEFCQ